MEERCKSCRFWKPVVDDEVVGAGLCRRRAPLPILIDDQPKADWCAEWPRTFRTDWCGQWKAKRP